MHRAPDRAMTTLPPKASVTASQARPDRRCRRTSTVPSATNSTSVSTSTTDEAMEVYRRDSKYAAKCKPRKAPLARHSSTSRRASVRSSSRWRRSVYGASSAAAMPTRYSTRIRDGAVDQRTNTADRDTPATPRRTASRFIPWPPASFCPSGRRRSGGRTDGPRSPSPPSAA